MIPLNVQQRRRSQSSKISGGGAKGINTRTYSEFLDLTSTLNTENYITEAEGDLVKRLGRILEKDITGSNALQVFKLSDDMWLLQYGTQISSYYAPTQTVTALETLSTSDDISAVKFGDYIFYTNKSSVIRYATFAFGANLITDIADFESTFSNSSNTFHYFWDGGSGSLFSMPNGSGTSVVNSSLVDISPTLGNKYNISFNASQNGNSTNRKLIGFFDTIDFSSNIDTVVVANSTNNLEWQHTFNVASTTSSVSETPSGTVDGVNTEFTVSNYYTDADIFLDGSGTPTTGCVFKGTKLTVPVAPTTAISLQNGVKLDSFTPQAISSFSVTEQDTTSLDLGTLSSSPIGNKLFIYDSRLVIGDMIGDEGLVQYSERYTTTNQESIPTTFNNWTPTGTPLEPDSAGNIALRELGQVNDFFQLGSQLGILYENGKAGYRITNDGVNQVVLQDFAYEDMGGFRAINTGQGVFYTNETGLWQLASGGNTSQPFSSSENNPSRRVFDDEFLFGLDFSDSDIIHDYVRGLILTNCKDTTENISIDLSNSSYSNKSLSVNAQDAGPDGIALGDSGTKMYMLGDSNNTVYQYTLSTAYDISTGSYASKSFSVSGQISVTSGIRLSSDGTKMFIFGDNTEVHEYDLSTAWDVSTASYNSVSFSTSSQESGGTGLEFNSDGTSMYIVGTVNRTVYQYTLSTAWDLSTASYASKSLDLSTEGTNPYGMSFNSNGTRLLTVDLGNDTVYEYILTTAYDVSTGSYSGSSLSILSEDGGATDIVVHPEDKFFYIAGDITATIYQYDIATNNNLILWYNIENKSFGKITGWNIKNFLRVANDIYAGESDDTQIYLLFSGNSDAGLDITSELKQEIQGRDLRALMETILKGEFNASTNLTINFDVYDKNGTLTSNFLTTALSVTGNGEDFQRWAERTRIREYSKIVMTVTSTDSVAHKINEIELVVQQKGSNRKFNA